MAVARSRLVYHPGAAADLEAIIEYFGGLDASLPARFRARFREQVDRLSEFPDFGALLFDEFRRVVIKRFPYMLVYRVRDAEVQVLAIVSFRRDPSWVRQAVSSRSADV